MDSDLVRLWQIPTRVLGPALKGAFQTLWTAAGGKPDHIVITAAWLGAACGAEPRTAWGWIQALATHRLLDVVERDERRGAIQLYLYRPTVVLGPVAAEPAERQGLLPLSYDMPEVGGLRGGLRAQTPERSGVYAGGSGVCAHKPPSQHEKHTLYPRTCAHAHAVDDEVEDEDESTVESFGVHDMTEACRTIGPAEASEAQAALLELEDRWREAGLPRQRDPAQLEEDRSIIRRAYMLWRRGLIPEAVWAEACQRPVGRRQQGRRVKTPASQFTKRCFEHPGFGKLLGALKEPLQELRAERPPVSTRASPEPASPRDRECNDAEQDELRAMMEHGLGMKLGPEVLTRRLRRT